MQTGDDAQRTPPRNSRLLLWTLGALVLVRVVSLAGYPFMDTTEARYADIARQMTAGHDWVTPRFSGGVPFWGKPPLSFWASALGFRLLGFNEFAARLPHLLLGALVIVLVWRHAVRQSRRAAWHAAALLAGSALFLVASGTVMTDMALTAGTTLVMVGFWRAVREPPGDRVGWVQIVLGGSLGLLAKGPVALVLCGVPIAVWAATTGHLRAAWRRVPWLPVSAAVLALSVPWYLLAEARTPGFLRYFIVGEHWHRFVTPGWTGDLYGGGHRIPHGMIWLYAIAATAPWSLLLPAVWLVARGRRSAAGAATGQDEHAQRRYLWAWALTPCVFFTLASNILWTYPLPGLPALAVLAAGWTSRHARRRWLDAILSGGLLAWSVTLAVMVATADGSKMFERNSARKLVEDYRECGEPGQPLYFLGQVPFSGTFYSENRALAIADLHALPDSSGGAYVVLEEARLDALEPQLRDRLTAVTHRGGRVLARWR